MKKAVHAVLLHVALSENDNYHIHCPTVPLSWCRYNKDIANKEKTYKPGPVIPLKAIREIKPIFNDLSSDERLTKCLHGKTQNHNEAFIQQNNLGTVAKKDVLFPKTAGIWCFRCGC